MLLLSHVCVEFHDTHGKLIHTVPPRMIKVLHEAPDAIRQDPMFQMLKAEGSVQVPESKQEQKSLENDPLQGTDATGKSAKSSKTPKKKSSASETNPASESAAAFDPDPDPASAPDADSSDAEADPSGDPALP